MWLAKDGATFAYHVSYARATGTNAAGDVPTERTVLLGSEAGVGERRVGSRHCRRSGAMSLPRKSAAAAAAQRSPHRKGEEGEVFESEKWQEQKQQKQQG